jgi:hypothetical protein
MITPSLTQIPFDNVTAALLDSSKTFPPRFLNRLTDLPPEEEAKLKEVWPRVADWRRKALLEDLVELTVTDMILSFEAVGRVAVEDDDPIVRKLAVHLMAEYESFDLIPLYIRLVQEDPDAEVRAGSASALGNFIYMGEMDKMSKTKQTTIEECLLQVVRGSDAPLVRRRALESLGYSGRDEVIPLIEQAYHAGKREWLVSALFAMGRSANEIWSEKVLAMLDSEWPTVCAEAVTAAGELGLKEARPQLIQLVNDEDDRVRTAAVWSLSQIGGERVRALLEDLLDQVEDDDEVSFLEDALENLSFTEDEQLLLFEFDKDDLADDDDDDDDD